MKTVCELSRDSVGYVDESGQHRCNYFLLGPWPQKRRKNHNNEGGFCVRHPYCTRPGVDFKQPSPGLLSHIWHRCRNISATQDPIKSRQPSAAKKFISVIVHQHQRPSTAMVEFSSRSTCTSALQRTSYKLHDCDSAWSAFSSA